MPRILFVAMANSIHTARWINQLEGQGWSIHIFPSMDSGVVHPDFKNITVHHSIYGRQKQSDRSVNFRGFPVISKHVAFAIRCILKKQLPNYRQLQLKRTIEKFKPDVIHSMEIQNAGYLTLETKKLFKDQFPPWIVTNWGSDIFLFGRLSEHEPKIRKVLSECDYYSCECHRDIALAQSFGFKGEAFPVFPNTGGFDIKEISKMRRLCRPTSERHIIMLKGYQGWSGRALVGLRAIERCAKLLKGYRVVIYSADWSPEVKIAAELLTKSTGIPTSIIPAGTAHKEILRLHGQARISIGLSISDGISTSLLEAMAMGSFPIQSYTACADEWIKNEETGMLVHPDDPETVESAIHRAITDDVLVNKAVEQNFQLVAKKLDQSILKLKAIEMYKRVYNNHCT